MKYLTIQEVQCVGDLTRFDERLDDLMNALLDLEEGDPAIEDPDLAATLPAGTVDVQMMVEADDPAEAMVKALCFLRSACDLTSLSVFVVGGCGLAVGRALVFRPVP